MASASPSPPHDGANQMHFCILKGKNVATVASCPLPVATLCRSNPCVSYAVGHLRCGPRCGMACGSCCVMRIHGSKSEQRVRVGKREGVRESGIEVSSTKPAFKIYHGAMEPEKRFKRQQLRCFYLLSFSSSLSLSLSALYEQWPNVCPNLRQPKAKVQCRERANGKQK